jgi:pilus assembly protein CpaC
MMRFEPEFIPGTIHRIIRYSLLLLVVTATTVWSATKTSDYERVMIGLGQTDVLEFSSSVKRVSIANPEIADATVTTPHQILINGKLLGVTSMVVWDEQERYSKFKLIVHSENTYHQVMLKVRFAEVSRTAFQELGFNFLAQNIEVDDEIVDIGSFAGKVNTPSIPLTLNDNVDFFLSVPTQDVSTIVKALEERALLTTLANPSLSAINGAEATFLAGGEIPVPIVSGISNQVVIEYKEFGIRLKFVPTVLDSELINIKVATEVSSLDFDNGIVLGGFQIPALISRKAETTIELRNGEHFAIGGLVTSEISEASSGIPFLGRIPILGLLFSSKRFLNAETELLVMVSPRIVQTMREETVPQLHE